jgi:ATP phosphoribosyltransferase regulatory subunit
MAFFRALTDGFGPDVLASIRVAVDHKNSAGLASALAVAGLTGSRHDLLYRLPHLIGGPEVLEEARALSTDLTQDSVAIAALDRLAEVYRLLQAYGVAERVILDLGEVRGMDYYTGISFRGVAPGLGWPIVSGGRYDNLVIHFGRPLAAIGFGLGIERALLVQSHQGVPSPSVVPHVLVHGCNHPACIALVGQLRQCGCRVAIDVVDLDGVELATQARQRGISRTLHCAEAGWILSAEDGERSLPSALLLQEAKAWCS